MAALGTKGRLMKDGGLAWGATNSGKSFSNAHHFARRLVTHPGKHLLIGANLKLMRGEIIPLIRSVANSYGARSSNYNSQLGTFGVDRSTVIVVAGAQEGSEDRLRTYHNIDSIMAEEVTVMNETFFNMALSRQAPDPGPVWASCNPSHPMNWVKTRLDAGRWPFDQMFLVEDNPALTTEQRETFEAQFTGVFRKRMVEALWASPEGLVYPQWFDAPREDAERLNGQPCFLGADYGESSVTCAHYAQLDQGPPDSAPGAHYTITREYYWNAYNQGERNPDQHAQAIKDNAPGRILAAYVDPSAVDLKEALRRSGVHSENAYNKADGYGMTDGMLQRGRMRIVGQNCPSLKLQIHSLVYDRHGERPDINCVDHATDGLRYLCCGLWEGRQATIGRTVYR